MGARCGPVSRTGSRLAHGRKRLSGWSEQSTQPGDDPHIKQYRALGCRRSGMNRRRRLASGRSSLELKPFAVSRAGLAPPSRFPKVHPWRVGEAVGRV